jgi:hypothetical protein
MAIRNSLGGTSRSNGGSGQPEWGSVKQKFSADPRTHGLACRPDGRSHGTSY